jgi:deoxyhypusine synthase
VQIRWRLSQEPLLPGDDERCPDPLERAATRCKIFLGYTSNLVSAGVREHIRYLVQVRAAWAATGCFEQA